MPRTIMFYCRSNNPWGAIAVFDSLFVTVNFSNFKRIVYKHIAKIDAIF